MAREFAENAPARFLALSGSSLQDDVSVACRALFDAEWYRARYPDVAGVDDALGHYLRFGAAEGRWPHPIFDPGWYLAQNPDVAAAGANALAHYVQFGGAEGRDPHPAFDGRWYAGQAAGVRGRGENPLLHYLRIGERAGASPNRLFDPAWYTARHPAVAPLGKGAFWYYLAHGAALGHAPCPGVDLGTFRAMSPGFDAGRDEPLAYCRLHAPGLGPGAPTIARRAAIAVVYLARSEDGSTAGVDAFAASYRAHRAGLAHDLIVIRKGGTRKDGARRALDLLFAGLEAQFVDTPDIGFDVQAYLRMCLALTHDHVCFLNTHSAILADDWLAKLAAGLGQEGIGAVGASASYESLHDSVVLHLKTVWLAGTAKMPFDEAVASEFRAALSRHVPDWLEAPPPADPGGLGDAAVRALDRDLGFAQYWFRVTRNGAEFEGFDRFARFPNPHLRTNGFLIGRELLLSLGFALEESKRAGFDLESGADGLTARLRARGLDIGVVGADGVLYRAAAWPQSRTFRLGGQENLLVTDNRARDFATAPAFERLRLQRISWGEYAGTVPAVYRRLGFDFSKAAKGGAPPAEAERMEGRPVFGVVVLAREGGALTGEALRTVLAQEGNGWICTVLEDGSDPALRPLVQAVGEGRVRLERIDGTLDAAGWLERAVAVADGDYVVLLDAADGLAPGALARAAAAVEAEGRADLLVAPLVRFLRPSAQGPEPSGWARLVRHGLCFDETAGDVTLPAALRRTMVDASMQFRRVFAADLPSFAFRRAFLESLRREGRLFAGPMPDVTLAHVALWQAGSALCLERPLAIAGVRAVRGDSGTIDDRLGARVEGEMLPGDDERTRFLLAMVQVREALGDKGVTPIRMDRYRKGVIWRALEAGGAAEEALAGRLSGEERAWVERVRGATEAERVLIEAELAMDAPEALVRHEALLGCGTFADLPGLFLSLEERWR